MSTATLLSFPPSSTPLPPSEQPHLLPFNIAHTGPAPVSTYFLPRPADGRPPSPSPSSSNTEGDSAPLQLAAFRGRQVVGQPLVLPEGYAGLLLEIPAPPSSSLSPTSLSSAATAAAVDASSFLGPRRPAHLLPTPTPSLSSSSTGEGFDDPEDMEAESSTATRVTRASPRRKRAPPARYGGGGGVAGGATMAKRRNVVAANKFRLDSDSEGEEAKAVVAPPDAAAEEEKKKKKKKEEAELEQQARTVDDGAAPTAAPAPPLHIPIASASQLTNDAPSTTTATPPSPPSPPRSPADADGTPTLLPPAPPLPTRTLHARSTFTNITLWTPDDPVDAARDEFFRALGKGGWVELAGELHREEEEEEEEAEDM